MGRTISVTPSDMPNIFEALFVDATGQLVVANLHAAVEERLLHEELIKSFASSFAPEKVAEREEQLRSFARGLSREKPPPSRSFAEDIVFRHPERYQLAGPAIRDPIRNLVNIRTLSSVHEILSRRYEPNRPLFPQDPEVMYAEVNEFILHHPDEAFGSPRRLLWIAEQDDAIRDDVEWLLAAAHGSSDEAAQTLDRVMCYFGLPIEASTPYLITELSYEDWGTRLNEDTYRRPTAFDGVNGAYFKQRRLAACHSDSEWNKTIDLLTALGAAEAKDGAWEAVGKPLQMGRIKRTAVVQSSDAAKPVDPERYVCCVRELYASFGIDWYGMPNGLTALLLEPGSP